MTAITMHEALAAALKECAEQLGLALGMEGAVFTPPLTLHLRGKVVCDSAAQSSLGAAGLSRFDGALEVTVCAPAGTDEAAIMPTVAQVRKLLRRGRRISCMGGDIVLMTAVATAHAPRQDRRRILVRVPFYALLKEVQ